MKRFLKISAAVVAVGVAATLAGCGGCSGCAGCSGNTAASTVTSSNWFTGTSYKGIQPSFIMDENHPEYTSEKILYDVSFDNSAASNSSYSVDYKDGSFSTEFYATRYNWQNSYEGYKSEDSELVYCYKTRLSVSVKYSLKSGEESEWFADGVETESYFRPAGKNLQPVYSKQVIKSTSPNKQKAKSLADAYKSIDAVYENYYSRDCKEVTSVIKEAGKDEQTKTYGFNKVKNTLFDNSSLYIAVRSMKLTADYSQTVSLFSPAADGVSSYTISGTTKELAERKEVSAKLAEKGLYVPKTVDENGNPVEDAGINSVAMNINYTGGSLIGTTQTVWYAAIDNPDNNTARATMLKLSIPLSYNLGTLNYTLKEVQSTLWSGK